MTHVARSRHTRIHSFVRLISPALNVLARLTLCQVHPAVHGMWIQKCTSMFMWSAILTIACNIVTVRESARFKASVTLPAKLRPTTAEHGILLTAQFKTHSIKLTTHKFFCHLPSEVLSLAFLYCVFCAPCATRSRHTKSVSSHSYKRVVMFYVCVCCHACRKIARPRRSCLRIIA